MFKKIVISIFLLTSLVCNVAMAEEVQMNIGQRGVSFGSHGQANAILALMVQQPNKSIYRIIYTTDVDVVVFACDLEKQIIVRIHQDKHGHGTTESWNGDALYRLKKAAAGGSINDTPGGKLPGTFETF